MTADKLAKMVRTRPFVPLRIHLNDGRAIDITQSAGILVSRTTLEIGRNPDADGVFDGADFYHIPHITRVERMEPSQTSK